MGLSRPGSIQHPINAKQAEDLDRQLLELYRELGALMDILGLGSSKGDILVHNGTTWTRLGAGSVGQVLTVVPTAPAGLGWQTKASGGGDATGGGDRKYWSFGVPYGAL